MDNKKPRSLELIFGDGLARLHGENGRVTTIKTDSGQMIPTDLVVIAIGVKPNVESAKVGAIELGKTGARVCFKGQEGVIAFAHSFSLYPALILRLYSRLKSIIDSE